MVATEWQSLLVHSQEASRKQPSVVQVSCDQWAGTQVCRERGGTIVGKSSGAPDVCIGSASGHGLRWRTQASRGNRVPVGRVPRVQCL